jgi:hypothetical protein
MTSPGGFPIPSLARAAHELRAARAAAAECGDARDSYLHHRQCLVDLRQALRVYVSALERDGLPVASKLRQELALLALVDERHGGYRS